MRTSKILVVSIIFSITILSNVFAQPIIILTYRGQAEQTANDNVFSANPDYWITYKIGKGEALSQIIKKFYGGSGLDHRFVKLAIVTANPSAFAQENPNFMFAGATIHLPSLNQIQNLVLGKNIDMDKTAISTPDKQIFFFGS